MYVKWGEKKAKNPSGGVVNTLDALLVETRNGNSDANVVDLTVNLGTIEERFLRTHARDVRAFHQGLIWKGVTRKLDQLNLDAAVREAVEREISQRIPRPNAEWSLWAVTCIPRYDTRQFP
jgi:hypothetical protein